MFYHPDRGDIFRDKFSDLKMINIDIDNRFEYVDLTCSNKKKNCVLRSAHSWKNVYNSRRNIIIRLPSLEPENDILSVQFLFCQSYFFM